MKRPELSDFGLDVELVSKTRGIRKQHDSQSFRFTATFLATFWIGSMLLLSMGGRIGLAIFVGTAVTAGGSLFIIIAAGSVYERWWRFTHPEELELITRHDQYLALTQANPAGLF